MKFTWRYVLPSLLKLKPCNLNVLTIFCLKGSGAIFRPHYVISRCMFTSSGGNIVTLNRTRSQFSVMFINTWTSCIHFSCAVGFRVLYNWFRSIDVVKLGPWHLTDSSWYSLDGYLDFQFYYNSLLTSNKTILLIEVKKCEEL